MKKNFHWKKEYYPTSSIFLSLAILALLRVKTLSGAESLPSGELGRMIGLDRIPEVKRRLEKYLTDKEELKTAIECYELEIEQVKGQKKNVPYKNTLRRVT